MAKRLSFEKVGAVADLSQIELDRYEKAMKRIKRLRKSENKKQIYLKTILRHVLITIAESKDNCETLLKTIEYDND